SYRRTGPTVGRCRVLGARCLVTGLSTLERPVRGGQGRAGRGDPGVTGGAREHHIVLSREDALSVTCAAVPGQVAGAERGTSRPRGRSGPGGTEGGRRPAGRSGEAGRPAQVPTQGTRPRAPRGGQTQDASWASSLNRLWWNTIASA